MSNFRSKAFNPASKRVEVAEYCDDYYGRHRYGIRFDDGCVHPEAQCGIDAAATAIDSLLKERDALKEERDQWRTQAKYETDVAHAASEEIARLNQERDALQARVKELEAECFRLASDICHAGYGDEYGHHRCREVDESEARALRAEQELDEAYERAAKVAESEWQNWQTYGKDFDGMASCKEVAAAIRRLAGPEKEGK